MCKQGETSPLIVIGNDGNKKVVNIDNCIYGLVKCLNDAGFPTKACCCGHGKGWGNIALQDGMELIIVYDYDKAREIDMFLNSFLK